MVTALRQSWALLLGIALLMVGNGLLLTLLGVRASLESFSPVVTGIIQSGYFAGFFVGSLVTPGLVGRVGHVRVFAALASLASTAALIHAIQIDPVSWTLMRFASGLCFAGLYVVAESWLNDASSNETRGQIISIYIVIQNIAFALGQGLLNAADPGGVTLFILSSVVVSIALVPMLLSAAPAPMFGTPTRFGLRALYGASPFGVVSIVGSGLVVGAYFSLATVYGGLIGLSLAGTSLLMMGFTLGGSVLQFPIGRASDRFDRRSVIIAVNLAALAVALALVFRGEAGGWPLFALVAVLGGLAVPTYALAVSHTNDFVDRAHAVAVSAGLIMVYGASAALGPVLASSLMELTGPAGLFGWIAGVHLAVALFGFYRVTRRAAVPNAEQGAYVAQSTTMAQATVALYSDLDEADEGVARIEGGPLFPAGDPQDGAHATDAAPEAGSGLDPGTDPEADATREHKPGPDGGAAKP